MENENVVTDDSGVEIPKDEDVQTPEVLKIVEEGDTISYFNSQGRLHNTEGPAIVNKKTGEKVYALHGIMTRKDGPAHITSEKEEWRYLGKLHNENGPAIVYLEDRLGDLEYWKNNQLHNENSAAVVFANNSDANQYWVEGIYHEEIKNDKQLVKMLKYKRMFNF